MKKYIKEKSENYSILDESTGELLDHYEVRTVDIDAYITVFFSLIPEVMKLNGRCIKVLMCCWKKSSFDSLSEEGNLLHNNQSFKDYVRSTGCDITDGAIDNCISILAKRGLLIRRCRGEYLLNPNYFFKGSLSDRSKLRTLLQVNPVKTSKSFFLHGIDIADKSR